jgi:TolB-like protein/Tfp pilus assembly protein PilF
VEKGRWTRIEALFHQAADLELSDRPAFLRQACGDEELRREVESLLAADMPNETAIEDAIVQAVSQIPADSHGGMEPGTRIGCYTITGLIGKGGMGVVYRAVREDDFRLQVAIKLLKRGTDTEAALRRFRTERQILAGLQHPNIARLHDGGATGSGLPYFVMEYVEGTPLLACAARLNVRERLELFHQVCSAVQYAHEKQIVHRDIKPANILVTPEGVVKLLDFGIAKLLDPAAEGAPAALTITGMRLMTPEYASPEQVRGEPVTPATDVYSLGSVLYELLTGERAHPLQSYSAAEIEREICVREPRKPSAIVRDIDPDLDNIILKALRREPERRYASAHDLSQDLDRFLKDLPVRARKENMVYRGRKFLKRNRALVMTAMFSVVIALALGAGLGRFTSGGGGEARSIAVLPFENASRDPQQELLADGMTDALIGGLSKIKSLRVISRDSVMRYKNNRKPAPQTARELHADTLVEGSVERSGSRVRINVHMTAGNMDRTVWSQNYERELRDLAMMQNEAAKDIAREIQIKLSPQEYARLSIVRTINEQAYEAYLKGRYHWSKYTQEGFDKSLRFFREAIDIDPAYGLPWAGLADAYYQISNKSLSPGEAMPKARAAAQKALAIDGSLAEAHALLAQIQAQFDWDWAAAAQSYQRALELNPSYAYAHLYYSWYLAEQGRMDEAVREAAEAHRLDPLPPLTATHLAWTNYMARHIDEAITQYRKIQELDPNAAVTHFSLGLAYEQKGMFDQATAEFLKAAANDSDQAPSLLFLGHVYGVSGKREEARSALEKLLELSRQRYVDPFYFGMVHLGLGETTKAFEFFEKAYHDRSEELLLLKVDPRFDGVRSDPRYRSLVRRIGLPP